MSTGTPTGSIPNLAPEDIDASTSIIVTDAGQTRNMLVGDLVGYLDDGLPADIVRAPAGILPVLDGRNLTNVPGGGGGGGAVSSVNGQTGVVSLNATDVGAAAAVHTHLAIDITNFGESVDDRIASTLVAGSNVTLTYNDAGNQLTIAAAGGVDLATLASYLQINNLVSQVNVSWGDPSANSLLGITGAGAAYVRPEIAVAPPNRYEIQAGLAAIIDGGALKKMHEFQTISPVSNIVTIPSASDVDATTREYGVNWYFEFGANTSVGLADRITALNTQLSGGVIRGKNTSGSSFSLQMIGGSGGRVPFALATGAANPLTVGAGVTATIDWVYYPSSAGGPVVVFNPRVYS